MAQVQVPPLMRDLTGGQATVSAPGDTVAQVIKALNAAYPGFGDRLAPDGRLAPGLALVVDGQVAAAGLRTPVREESTIRFLPAVSGG